MGQQSYTRDLLNRHQVEHPRPVPMTKADAELPEEEQPALENIRQAQTVVGELLWLSIRTRPDISFAVSQLGRQVNKRPKWVVKTAQQVFGYLKGTETQHLSYGVCTSDDRGPEDDLPFHREMQQVEMFSDISFAPAGERSLQGILGFYGGGLVQWEASRQAFVVLSTAEGELMSYLESMVMGDSLASLIEVVEGRKIGQKIIYGDNTAAIAILENPDGPWRTRHLRLRATALRERLKDGSWIIRHLPGVKLVADFLTKIIAVKPSWERFWRFVNHQGSGVPNEEPLTGSNRREEQPPGEEQHPEEPDQETPSWDNYRDIAGRCVSVVKKVVGLAEEYPELADFRHEALSTAIGRLVQVLADARRVTESVVKDRFQLESVLPFLEKKNIPGQVEHPVEEEPRGILKRGNRSKRGNSKTKRVHFWDESPPILKVLQVQDHHGHVPQEHSAGKVEHFHKTIQGGGQGNHWDLDLARSKRKEHRAAEGVPRSGPTETRDQVAVRGMEFLGSVLKIDEIQLHGKPSKGIAPQPKGTQGDQKEKEVRILLQVGTEKEKEKEELKKDRSPGKVHRWLEKKIIKTQGKDH